MGCDIHMYIEVKKNGKWILFPGQWKNALYHPEMSWAKDAPQMADQLHSPYPPFKCDGEEEPEGAYAAFYTNRNYDFFGMLADVRNSGFMGIQYKGKQIANPRGLPDDVCPEIKKASDDWGDDAHSHSWLTLEELNKFPWRDLYMGKHQGYLNYAEYLWYLKYGKPQSWCGDVAGRDIQKVTNKRMNEIVEENELKNGLTVCPHCGVANAGRLICTQCGAPLPISETVSKDLRNYYTQVTWGESYYESADDFVDHYLPLLNEFVLGYEDLRIVFWFDN